MIFANAWFVYMDEPYHVDVDVTSPAAVTSAQLRVRGHSPVPMTITASGGSVYQLEADVTFVIPGMFDWSIEIGDALGNQPLVAAIGTLRVDRRVRVA